MISTQQQHADLRRKLHGETARIAWRELQRFFAQGRVLVLADDLDLVEVAAWFAQDNAAMIEPRLTAGEIKTPSDALARNWFDNDRRLWSVVVAPFVLVQEAGGVARSQPKGASTTGID